MPQPASGGGSVVIGVTEASQVGEARRAAVALARQAGFGETAIGKLALVVTEAANNLVKHARQGLLLMRQLDAEVEVTGEGIADIEVLSLDSGPGMTDISRCLGDGYSTAGSPGTGLGAMRRLSSLMDIYSTTAGTAIVMHVSAAREGISSSVPPTIGAVCVPVAGETFCGDAWAVRQEGSRIVVTVVDGLGHGPLAADASRAARLMFLAQSQRSPEEILKRAHDALRSTRGAAMAVAEIDVERESVRYAGVGNIAGCVLAGSTSRSMVSHNGTLGHQTMRFQGFDYPFPRGSTLLMHSDGLASR